MADGKTMLLKIGDGQATEAFVTLGGLNTKGISWTQERSDNTAPPVDDPTGMIFASQRAGAKSMSLTGTGLVREDHASWTRLKTVVRGDPATCNWQIIDPSDGTYQGAFDIELEQTGTRGNDIEFSISLTSNGAWAFTAA